MNHVPYKGGGPAIIDVISGQIQVILPAAQSVVTHIRLGRLRALAITGEERWNQLPDVPTLDESGIKGYILVPWYGLWFPGGTRIEYVDRIQSEVAKAVKDPEAKRLFEEQGLKGVGSRPADLERAIQQELTLVKKLATMAGIVPQ
jgi:tripartite-type tricarboxylate transporter receptor subunit TctC